MIRTLERVRTSDPDLRAVQDNVAAVVRDIGGRALLDGLLLDGVEVTTGAPVTVNHGLGRDLIGWVVVRKSATADVWDSQSTNRMPARSLVLNSSANVTLSIWVF